MSVEDLIVAYIEYGRAEHPTFAILVEPPDEDEVPETAESGIPDSDAEVYDPEFEESWMQAVGG